MKRTAANARCGAVDVDLRSDCAQRIRGCQDVSTRIEILNGNFAGLRRRDDECAMRNRFVTWNGDRAAQRPWLKCRR